MCIVIDTCVYHKVFGGESEYTPVFDWIYNGIGKMVYGGSKYKKECTMKMRKYGGILAEFERKNKIVFVNDEEVDNEEERISNSTLYGKKVKDAHLIAIISKSGCKLICTDDTRCHVSLKSKCNYPHHVKVPKLYTSQRNHDLLTRENMAHCCEPFTKLRKKDKEEINTTSM